MWSLRLLRLLQIQKSIMKGHFATRSKCILGALKLDAVTFSCLTPSGIQTPELGSLSSTWDVLRAKGRILLGGVQPRGSQRKALEAKARWFFHGQDFLPVRNTERIFSSLQPLVSQRIPNVLGKFYFLWNYQLLKYIFYPPMEFAFQQHEIGIDFPCLMMVENISDVPALSDCQGHSSLCGIFIMI